MGRLQTLNLLLLLLAAVVLVRCNDKPKKGTPTAPTARREGVMATSSPSTPSTPPPASTKPPPKKPRVLCAGAPLDRAMPPKKVGHAEAPGEAPLGTTIPVGNGRWTWINLWAAWCVPCKEEMPRLLKWQQSLASSLTLHFLSLDDDERQMMRFLKSQPKDGVRTSYWLPEGKTREEWLKHVNIKGTPELPVQILVNPRGKVHCIIQGAVEDEDLPRVKSIVSSK